MSDGRRKALLLVLATMAVVAAVMVAVVLLVDVDRYRGAIADRMAAALGRPVELGEIRLSLLRGVALSIEDVTVGALPDEGDEPLLRADSVRVGVRTLPLLRGRLEVTSATVERPIVRIERSADGEWNLARLVAGRGAPADEEGSASGADGAAHERAGDEREPAATARGAPEGFSIDRLELRDARVEIVDAAVSPVRTIALTDLELELGDVATGETARFSVTSGVGQAGGRVRAEGTAGPLGIAGEPLAVAARVELEDLEAGGVATLAQLAGVDLPIAAGTVGGGSAAGARRGVSSTRGRLDAISGTVELESTWPERSAARGELDLGTVVVGGRDAAPGVEPASVEVAARFAVEAENGIDLLRVATLEIEVDDATLSISGSVESAGEARRIDLALEPVELAAARLQAFVELAFPSASFALSSPNPVAVSGRVRGTVRPGETPPVEARLRLADVRFSHDALALPIEHVSADVSLAGERLVAEEFQSVIGDSDLRGEIRVEGWVAPRVRFDLASRRANLDQLFGILEVDRARRPGEREEPSGMLDRIEAEGRIRVEQVSWGELEASDLVATIRVSDGVVRLDPLDATIYAGRFSGRVEAWPERSPLPFELSGRAENVRVGEFLSQALGLTERLDGRFTGTIQSSGAAGEWEQVARSLSGRGEMRIEEGRVQSFPLLRTVAEISGVFGEKLLQEIANRLASSATQFAVLRGAFRVEDGALQFDELVLESQDFLLRGEGAVDLLSAALDGDAAMIFSAELSERMLEEGSRAAELFANAETGRVALPLGLRGALSDPSATVDWESAVRSYAGRRVEREIERQVGRLFERILGADPTPTPSPPR